jgi:hypothetical protein
MIPQLPLYISIVFVLTVFATLALFVLSIKNATTIITQKKAVPFLTGLVIWLVLQSVLTLNNIYNTNLNVLPPKLFVLGIAPTVMALVLLFTTQTGKQFIDSLSLKHLTILNMVRILVELVLFWLFIHKALPQIMTFEGRNLDIIAGITAPIMAYLFFIAKKINHHFLLIWNCIGILLLINIIGLAILSAPTPIQLFGLTQPNIAILYFPFSLLPTFIVPIVMLSHLTALRQLLKKKEI